MFINNIIIFFISYIILGIRSMETLYLHPSSLMNAVFPNWVMYSDVVRTGKYFMNNVSELGNLNQKIEELMLI
jgi:hypothetical protein